MATKAERLTDLAAPRINAGNKRKSLSESIRRWAQKGQLGSSRATEMSRYTGGRI